MDILPEGKMSREIFHASLSDKEQEFWKAMAEKFGKLKYEGEKASPGYVVQDHQPHRVTR